MSDVSGLSAIITGGASGIGAASVAALVRGGARCVVMDIDHAKGAQCLDALGDRQGNARYIACDIADRGNVDQAFDEAVGWLGGLDVLACIAGVTGNIPAETLEPDAIERMIAVNFMGTVHCNQAAFRHMQHRGGRIINCGSMAALRPLAGYAHYAAAKAAVLAWTRNCALEWGVRGISVNAIAPAALTPMALETMQGLDDAALQARLAATAASSPLGIFPTAEDAIAPLMLFLASAGSSYLTGQTLCIDGGRVMLGS